MSNRTVTVGQLLAEIVEGGRLFVEGDQAEEAKGKVCYLAAAQGVAIRCDSVAGGVLFSYRRENE